MQLIAAVDLTVDLGLWSNVIFVIWTFAVGMAIGRPLVAAMNKRQSTIVEDLRQAEIAIAETDKIRVKQAEDRKLAKRQAKAMVEEAERDAVRVRTEVVDRAKTEAELLTHRVDKEIHLATQKALYELWNTAAVRSAELTEKTLRTRLSPDDHRRLIGSAIDEIGVLAEAKI